MATPVIAWCRAWFPPLMRGTATAVIYLVINIVGFGLGIQLMGLLGDALVHLGPNSLRYALTIMVAATLCAAFNFILAARMLRGELAAATLNEEIA
ncbi:hypothetical protein [Sphingobium estronivorans]|uniref:hypothetical protein n=1 Tax=Sphingobium estronivorans TaxID=1577690 RepID=UPI0013C2E023|nr:hypothetical protein [Sphingobium estronivorans]